jgi:hypothetical protein
VRLPSSTVQEYSVPIPTNDYYSLRAIREVRYRGPRDDYINDNDSDFGDGPADQDDGPVVDQSASSATIAATKAAIGIPTDIRLLLAVAMTVWQIMALIAVNLLPHNVDAEVAAITTMTPSRSFCRSVQAQ